MTTPFSALLAGAITVGDTLELAVPADWAQGRSVFGGLQVAFAVRAMRAHVDPAVPLRTLQVTFVGPISGTLHARAEVLRKGSSTTHVEVRLHAEDGSLATIVIGVFGTARRSAVAIAPVQPAAPSATRFDLVYLPGVVPAFIQHFHGRWLRGAPPFSGSTERAHVIEIGLRDSATVASEAHAIAFADFTPPLGLTFLRAPANGSTVTWMLELLVDRFDVPLDAWRIDVELASARDGYTSQGLAVWAPDGTPVAFGRQSMMVFG